MHNFLQFFKNKWWEISFFYIFYDPSNSWISLKHFFSFDPSVDKLAIVKKQIEDTKAQMADNIGK